MEKHKVSHPFQSVKIAISLWEEKIHVYDGARWTGILSGQNLNSILLSKCYLFIHQIILLVWFSKKEKLFSPCLKDKTHLLS